MLKDTDGDGIFDKYDKEPLLPNKSYDRQAVYDYLCKYSGDEDLGIEPSQDSQYVDLNKLDEDLSDCTNFVSQCLIAGGFEMNNDWYFGEAGNIESHFIGYFSNTGTWDYGWSRSWSVVEDNYNYVVLNDYPMYEISIDRDDNIGKCIDKYDVRVGDLMYFCRKDTDGNEYKSHATIISHIDNKEIYYSSHSKPRYNKKLSGTFEENGFYTKVVIVCLSGRLT